MAESRKVCVGQIGGAHGVRGAVKLRSFTEDPTAIAAYGPLTDESGRKTFEIELLSSAGDQWLARVVGVSDRNAAETLKGQLLYVDRSALPDPEEDEFYHADLIGLTAELTSGERLGRVVAVHDFGGGEFVEVKRDEGGIVALPFTQAVVPTVDLKGGRIVVEPPEGALEPHPSGRKGREARAASERPEAPKGANSESSGAAPPASERPESEEA